MPYQNQDMREASRLRLKALSRWDNEGGAGPDQVQERAHDADPPKNLPLTTVEPVQPAAGVIGSEQPRSQHRSRS